MCKSLVEYYKNNVWSTNKTNLFYKDFLHSADTVTQENTLKT